MYRWPLRSEGKQAWVIYWGVSRLPQATLRRSSWSDPRRLPPEISAKYVKLRWSNYERNRRRMSRQRLMLTQGKTLLCLGEMAFSTLRTTVYLKRREGSTKLLSRMEIWVTSSPSHKSNSTSLSEKILLRYHTKGPEDQLAMNPFSTWKCKLFSDKEPGNDSSCSLKCKENVEGEWIYMLWIWFTSNHGFYKPNALLGLMTRKKVIAC